MNESIIAVVECPAPALHSRTHGPHGHVLCRQCGREVLEISKEVAPEYAYCVHHRPNHQQEDRMSKALSAEVKAANKDARAKAQAVKKAASVQAKADKKAAAAALKAQAKADKKAAALMAKEAKKVKAGKKKDKAPDITLKAKANGTKIPQRGNMATFLQAIEHAGGLTKDQIHEQASSFGLGGKSWMHACYYAGKLKLLKVAAE